MNRLNGTLEFTSKEGTEFRYHVDDKGITVVRVPWHFDKQANEWYSGIVGPPMQISILLDSFVTDTEIVKGG